MWTRSRQSLWGTVITFLLLVSISFSQETTTSSLEAQPLTKIFGVGLSKTGTTSLGQALELLGYANLHSDRWLVPFLYSDGRASDFTERYASIDAVEDIPTAAYFPDLLQEYQDAKFILTTRNVDEWFEAFLLHDKRMRLRWGGTYPFRVSKMLAHIYGSSDPDPIIWKSRFTEHYNKVRSTIPSNQLLELNVLAGEGFEKLCPFLNRTDGPCADLSESKFPHLNMRPSEIPSVRLCEKTTQTTGRFAYVSLLSQPSLPARRDYLISFLVLVESIRRTNTTADIVVLVNGLLSAQDEFLILSQGVKIVRVSRFGKVPELEVEQFSEGFAEAQLMKMRAFELLDYDRFIFLDADILLLSSADELFHQPDTFVAVSGSISPLNGGFFVGTPDCQTVTDLLDISTSGAYSQESGWFEYGPIPDWRQGHVDEEADWSFYGAHVDQGLLYYYFFCYQDAGKILPARSLDSIYAHFTGFYKPFLLTNRSIESIPERYRDGIKRWFELYEAVKIRLEANSNLTESAFPQFELSGSSAPVNVTDPYESDPDLAPKRVLRRKQRVVRRVRRAPVRRPRNSLALLRSTLQNLCLNHGTQFDGPDECLFKTMALVRDVAKATNSSAKI